MKRIAFTLMCGLISLPAMAQTTPAARPMQEKPMAQPAHADMTAKGFLTEAAKGGMAEVDLGKLAVQKASNTKVKAFAQKMVADHGKANDEVKALAAKKNITLPTAVDSERKAEHDRLAAMSGAAFDRAYVSAMVKDHNKDVAEFEHQSTMNEDADVKAWAAKTLPTLREHQRTVQALDKELSASTSR